MIFQGRYFSSIAIFSMPLSVYLWGIRLFTLLSLSAWVGIVVAVDPMQAGVVGMSLFCVSLFAFFLGVMTLTLTAIYCRFLGVASAAHHLGGIFRQALLFALFLVGIVFLQKERLLTWWDAALLLALILLVEFSFRKMFLYTNQE